MHFSVHTLLFDALLFAAALVAGAINSVAGGGTLLTFPTLLFLGVPPIIANATNTVALVPGSFSAMVGYRSFLKKSKREMLLLGVPSLIGGVAGALLLIHTGDKAFDKLIPWLIFGATGLFMAQEPVARYVRRKRELAKALEGDRAEDDDDLPIGTNGRVGIAVFQLIVSIYGGFFGAGVGIMMLAALGLMGFTGNIHRANGLKTFAAVCINGVASATFIIERKVVWPIALTMMVGAILGGYGGAGIARRLGQDTVRKMIVVIGIGIGIVMLFKRY